MPEEIRKKSIDTIERLARRSTKWVGSVNSILVHTALFIFAFTLYFFGVNFNKVLLVVTTLVSLEAIYLAIFIQMTVNRQSRRLRQVSREIDEIQEDIDEIQEDVEEIEEDDEEAKARDDMMLKRIESALSQVSSEIAELKKHNNNK